MQRHRILWKPYHRSLHRFLLRHRLRRRQISLYTIETCGTDGTLADTVIVMRDGRVVETGPSAEIFDRPRMDYTKALIMTAAGLVVARQSEAA